MRGNTGRAVVILVLFLLGFGPGGARQSAAQADCSVFQETGQEVCFDFLQYWVDHGGLAQQGYPISGRLQETSQTDGKVYLVQYFERAVFELHPENQPPYNVLLSQLGTLRKQEREGMTVSFMTDDGLKLSGSQYGTASIGVVLSALCSPTGKDAWTDLAVRLGKKGYIALTYYYRGIGASQGPGDQKMSIHDLHAAIAFVRSQGAKKLVLAGGSCGGTISAKVYGIEQPDALIVLSSPPTIPNLDIAISDQEIRAMTAPKLFVGSEGDQFTAPMLQMYDTSPQPKEKLIYTGNAHATDLFSSEHGKDLTETLLAFIQKSVPTR